MGTFISAGVYIQEQDESLYAPALSPTIIALVGTATKGPLNQAVFVSNLGQLIDTFGIPRPIDYGMQAAIEALKECRTVYFCRIAGAAATAGVINAADAGSGATSAETPFSTNTETFNLLPNATIVATINGPVTHTITMRAVEALVDAGNANNLNLSAINAGGAVTLKVAFDGFPAQTVSFTSGQFSNFAACTPAELMAAINTAVTGGRAILIAGGTKVEVRSDTFGSNSTVRITNGAGGSNANDATNGFNFPTTLQTSAGPNDVADIHKTTATEIKTRVEAFTTNAVKVDIGLTGKIAFKTGLTGSVRTINIVNTSTAVGASPLIDVPTGVTYTGSDAAAPANTVSFTAKTLGSHSSLISVVVSAGSIVGTLRVVVKYNGVTAETYDKLFKNPTPVSGGYDLVTTINNGSADGVWPKSKYVVAADLNVSGFNPLNGTYTLTAGNNGDDWTASTVIGTLVAGVATGLQVFANPEALDITLLATPGISYAAVILAGINLCLARADCMYIADAPPNLSAQQVVQWHNGDTSIGPVTVGPGGRTETNSTLFDSSYAALYYDWLQIFDVYTNANIEVPPSVLVLRTYAYNDQVAFEWFAPAGPNRTRANSVIALDYSPTLGERDLMQTPGNNVNPIAKLRGAGIVVDGEKTLQRAPTARDRVHVRRLLCQAEKIVARTVLFLMFDPNDQVMWRRFITLVTPIFEHIKANRGLFDFRVVADASTNTPDVISQSTFIGKIFLQEIPSAEKIVVPFVLVPQGVDVQEFAQQ